MNKKQKLEFKVGAFVTLGAILIMISIVMLGGPNNIFSRDTHYSSHFPEVNGLIPGAKVVLGGLHVGTVYTTDFDPVTKNIKVTFAIKSKYAEWIRNDSMAEIATQGLLGDKYISLSAGAQTEPLIAAGGEITPRAPQDLGQFLSKSDQLMVSLNNIAGSMDRMLKTFESGNKSEMFFSGMAVTAKNLSSATTKLKDEIEHLQFKKTMGHVNNILEKVDNGSGTLGALVNDPALYDDAKALVGGVNRNKIIRNLVRRTIRDSDKDKAAESVE